MQLESMDYKQREGPALFSVVCGLTEHLLFISNQVDLYTCYVMWMGVSCAGQNTLYSGFLIYFVYAIYSTFTGVK